RVIKALWQIGDIFAVAQQQKLLRTCDSERGCAPSSLPLGDSPPLSILVVRPANAQFSRELTPPSSFLMRMLRNSTGSEWPANPKKPDFRSLPGCGLL